MVFFTMQDAVDELRPRINGGTCRNETAIARINQATRRIMNRPRKPIHVERIVRFFTRKDFITLPREVEKVIHYTVDEVPAADLDRRIQAGQGRAGVHRQGRGGAPHAYP